jgi:transposase
MELTNARWSWIEPLVTSPTPQKDGRGRPARHPRKVLDGILWILRTGSPWKDMLKWYPPD